MTDFIISTTFYKVFAYFTFYTDFVHCGGGGVREEEANFVLPGDKTQVKRQVHLNLGCNSPNSANQRPRKQSFLFVESQAAFNEW